jgi:hypothetical protein
MLLWNTHRNTEFLEDAFEFILSLEYSPQHSPGALSFEHFSPSKKSMQGICHVLLVEE